MLSITAANARLWSMLGSRGTFGMAMLDAASQAEDVVVLTADLAGTAGLERFSKAFPERFFNVGIAEQNMVGIAAGLAREGYNVFVTTFSAFAAMRSYEQIRLHLGYMRHNIKVIGLAGGLAMGQFGNTHYGIEDLALMRAVPGLTVIAPADGAEIVKAIDTLVRYKGPVYVRLTGAMNNSIVNTVDYDFEIGTAVTVRSGEQVAIFACGTMVYECTVAARLLDEVGISASLTNFHTLKPLDGRAIDRAASSKLLVTVEEHGIVGGLAGAVAEYTSSKGGMPPLLSIGLPDQFGKNGDYKYLLRKYGLTGTQIARRIMTSLGISTINSDSVPVEADVSYV